MKKILLAIPVLLICLASCSKDDDKGVTPTPPEPETRTYLKTADRVLLGDTCWIRWTAAIEGANAAIRLSTLNPADSAYYGLAVLNREAREARVVFANDSFNIRDLPPVHYSRITISDGAATAAIDSFQLKAVIITTITKPRGGDTVMTGDSVLFSWRMDRSQVNAMLFVLNSVQYSRSELNGGMAADIDGQPFLWIVGAEDPLLTYENGATISLDVSDYDQIFKDRKDFVFCQ